MIGKVKDAVDGQVEGAGEDAEAGEEAAGAGRDARNGVGRVRGSPPV